jgi:oligopeptide transport system permease protein
MALAKGAEPISLGEAASQEKVRTPLGDALRQYRRNKLAVIGTIYVVFIVFIALTADLWKAAGVIEDPTYQHRFQGSSYSQPMTCTGDTRRMNPQWCFVFGTDILGRDNLSRIVYGSRVSLAVGLVGAATACVVGILYGVVSGFYGGRIDNFMMRIVDTLYAIPELPIIVIMQVFFKTLSDYKERVGPIGAALVDVDNGMGGLFFVFIVLGLTSWLGIARLARGQVLQYKQKEFVEAARSIGARDRRIIFSHLLPNIIGPLIVVVAGSVPGFIVTEAFLSYLGLGVNPPTPSWGQMISAAQEAGFNSYPWLIFWPAAALASVVMAFFFIGDGLRDAFDPRLRGVD